MNDPFRQMRWITIAFLVLGLTACTVATPIPTNTPVAIATRIQVGAGQKVSLPIEPRTGPTEVMPFLSLHAFILEEGKKIPVRARLVTLNGKEIARDASEINLQMPGDTRATPLALRVQADGYEPWELVFQHKINYSRTLDWDIVLRPRGQMQ